MVPPHRHPDRDCHTWGDFAAVTRLVNDAITAHRLPGAVVQVGHAGRSSSARPTVRKLLQDPAGRSPSAAEPMTADTIFDGRR